MTDTNIGLERSGHVVTGVDTHKHIHVAAALDPIGGLLSTLTIATDSGGFAALLEWALTFGRIIAFGVEGTGSYGAGLTSYLHRQGHKVIEVSRPDRRMRRLNGKSDTLDAQNAAQSVLAGLSTATAKTMDGTCEMLRELKVAHDTAVKARSQAMIALKAVLVHSEETLRKSTTKLTQIKLARHCAALRPSSLSSPVDANRHALKRLAKRWLFLNEEAQDLEKMIKTLVKDHALQLLDAYCIGPDTAAEILIAVGDNPQRIRSEAALAKLAGISPVPAGSGMNSGKHRINHAGHRQPNAAIYRVVIARMRYHQPTIDYVTQRTSEGKPKRDIIRCLKRYVIREVYQLIKANPHTRQITA